MRRAKIRWLKASEGGRVAPPPGPKYSTVARFPEDATNWPEVAWSLVLEWSTPPEADGTVVVNVTFLSPKAPQTLLHPGATFELYEGRRRVATGEVLAG
jgi:hypothetical protein